MNAALLQITEKLELARVYAEDGAQVSALKVTREAVDLLKMERNRERYLDLIREDRRRAA